MPCARNSWASACPSATVTSTCSAPAGTKTSSCKCATTLMMNNALVGRRIFPTSPCRPGKSHATTATGYCPKRSSDCMSPESEPESELDKAEAELWKRAESGELSDEAFTEAWREMEENIPVSAGEVAQENKAMLKRRDSFRRVAEMAATGFGKLPFVQKVVLFGSVAAPPTKEVPRFRRLRRARV